MTPLSRVRALRDWLSTWHVAILLGLATIGSYGVAAYAIGVLIAPIAADTGWSTGAISAAYAIGVLGSGAVALGVGHTLDRRGSRPAFLVTLGVGSVCLFASASMASPLGFVVLWAAGSAAIGGGWYYQATMPAAARLYPLSRPTAFAVLTLLGALASPIFYPATGLLVEALGWRDALRTAVLAMTVLILPAALVVNAPPGAAAGTSEGLATGIRRALRRPAVWRAMLAIGLTAAATNALILHQVPAMQASGLTLAAASAYGGARGALQIPGRLVLTPLTRTLGLPRAISITYA
ncbi:MAG: MFS transporter, partial [Dehalococcoidia bacterium]